ncbi:DUF885 family protein [Caulobacter sp. 17J65-9]|uniref:DUF885 family protein n=1 Tax=Caulobacter sp. 17J65-9 TaxID=2709382 RepID=UPI0013CA5EC3|nr:DUF885 family protein [Caulobacter sp. 17J65-9]
MIDRRQLLAAGAGAGALAAAVPALAQVQTEDQKLDALLTRHLEENLSDSPEQVTSLGLDTGARAAMKFKLDDRSLASVAEDKARAARRLKEFGSIDRAKLSAASQVTYDITKFRYQVSADGAKTFNYGSMGGRPNPYIVSQLGGSYQSLPDWLDNQHKISNKDDADAYVSRLNAFATALDQETDRVKHDAGVGVIAPDFVLAKAIVQLSALRDTAPGETSLVRSLVRRAQAAGVAGDYEATATAIVAGPVRAALDRQIDALKSLQPKAGHDAGVWRLPKGEALYAHGLKSNTTTSLSGEEIHKIGLEQVAELQSEIDVILKAQGMTQGTVGERITALSKDPQHLYPNTDEGKAELLAALNVQVQAMWARLPEVFATVPKARVEIRRVPVTIEAGAPGGYYNRPSLDGSRPGAYYINLRDTSEWPKWGLPTLSYHEAVPGHHLQNALALEAGELPLYRRLGSSSSYNEGWGLYAEQLAMEMGVYENDPLGRVGFLQSYLFRAVRLVVDTGMHHKRWSREQAIKWMVDNCGEPESSAAREIERYCVWPGQACSYKIGHTVIARIRNEAKAKMGAKFDLKGFHDAVLLNGSVPLTVLERNVGAWASNA